MIIALNKRSGCSSSLKLLKVDPYEIDLADGNSIKCSHKASADITIVTPSGKAVLKDVLINILPGPAAPFLLGQSEMRRLRCQGQWQVVEDAISKLNASSGSKRDSAFGTTDVLDKWRQRRIDLAKDEVDSLAGLDSLFAHGGPEPTKSETRRSIERVVEKAASNGAPAWYLSELSDMILKEHSDCFRLSLGLDCPALVQPMVIHIKPAAKFHKLAKRFYPWRRADKVSGLSDPQDVAQWYPDPQPLTLWLPAVHPLEQQDDHTWL